MPILIVLGLLAGCGVYRIQSKLKSSSQIEKMNEHLKII